MTIIVEVVTKTSIILSITVILVAILRRSSAAARYLIWLTGLWGVLALPLVLYVVPSLSIPIPLTSKPTTVLLSNSRIETIKSSEINLPGQELLTSSASRQTSSTSLTPRLPMSWPTTIWLIGALFVATRSTWSICEIVKLRRASRSVTDSRLLELFAATRRELSISANISLRIGGELIPPMTWGAVRHTILLPAEAIGWSAERVRLVLTHELAHITRKDAAMQFVIYGACSLYWFNPLVWHAAKRMRIERECACDDQVLNLGVDVERYATHLVEIARSAIASRTLAVSITHPSHFEQRIRTLLDTRTNRRTFSRLGKSILAGAAAIFLLVTASAHLTAFPSSSLLLLTSSPLVPTQEAGLTVTTKQTASARNVLPKEETASYFSPSGRGDSQHGYGASGIQIAAFSASPTSLRVKSIRQAINTTSLAFEVESIKPPNPEPSFFGGSCLGIDEATHDYGATAPGTCRFARVSIKMLIGLAYGLRPDQATAIIGGPPWVSSERFDIEGRSRNNSATRDQLLQMLQTLLSQKFNLKIHREDREVNGFWLAASASGLDLVQSTANEHRAWDSRADIGGKVTMIGKRVTMADVCNLLAGALAKPIIDKTGLTGQYDMLIDWTTNDDSSLKAAIERFGLELQPQTIPTEIVVIDQVEKPIPDQ